MSGSMRAQLPRRPALSNAATPMPPGATAAPMAAGCAFIDAVFARFDTGPAALPCDPCAAPIVAFTDAPSASTATKAGKRRTSPARR